MLDFCRLDMALSRVQGIKKWFKSSNLWGIRAVCSLGDIVLLNRLFFGSRLQSISSLTQLVNDLAQINPCPAEMRDYVSHSVAAGFANVISS